MSDAPKLAWWVGLSRDTFTEHCRAQQDRLREIDKSPKASPRFNDRDEWKPKPRTKETL